MRNNCHRKPKSKRFLSTPLAADYIDRHRSTLDKWRAENVVLPYHRDGHKVMYAIEDLDAYLQATRVEPIAYSAHEVVNEESQD